jgi:carboxyl-terminal processing protease
VRSAFKQYFLPAALTILVALSLFNTWTVYQRHRSASAGVPKDLEKVWEAYRTIRERYVNSDEIDTDKLAEGAVKGMVEALDDPFASYFDPKQYESQVQNTLEGHFEGIGATVDLVNGELTIAAPLPGSPAEKAGLRPGDAILRVEGESIEGLTVYEVVQKIRGPRDTPVTITVRSMATGEIADHTMVRASLQFPTVNAKLLEGGVAWVKISQFAPQTTGELDKTIAEMRAQGAKALVLDLRGNLGGLLTTVLEVSGRFLDGGVVLVQVDSDGKRTEMDAGKGKEGWFSEPLVVLVNQYSASGSEVVAGALQARGRAQLVGTHTYGKGVVNLPIKLQDGSGLYLPTSTWYTPGGQPIGKEGIAPDVVVVRTLDDLYAGADPQLEKAIELMEAALAAPR